MFKYVTIIPVGARVSWRNQERVVKAVKTLNRFEVEVSFEDGSSFQLPIRAMMEVL